MPRIGRRKGAGQGRAALVLALILAPGSMLLASAAAAGPPAAPDPAAAAVDPAAADTPVEELVIELRAGRIASQTLLALAFDDEIYVPARPLFELIEIQAAIDTTGHLAALREPQGIQLEVSFEYQTARAGRAVFSREAAPMRLLNGELYLGTPLIAALLDLRVETDRGELLVVLDPADELPVGRRVARERARASRGGAEDQGEPDRRLVPGPERIAGAALDWGLALADLGAPATATYDLCFGTGFAGGSLDLRHRGNPQGRAVADPLTASWVRAWPEGFAPRQLRLGWVGSTGPRARAFHGIAASTAPYSRPAAFGEAAVRGWLGQAWDVELYRNGELVDYTMTDALGYYEIATPVDYGSNPVELRAFGPNGEVRELLRSIPIAADRLPAGEVEAEAGLGACDGPQCAGLANVDARVGINDAWTLRGGTDLFLRDRDRSEGPGTDRSLLVHPYTSVSGVLHEAWLLRAEAVGGAFAALEVGYEPSPDLRASALHEVFDPEVEDPVLTSPGQLSRTRVTAFYRPDPRRRAFFLTLGAQDLRGERDRQSRLALGLSGQVRNVRLNVEGRSERLRFGAEAASAHILGVNASTALRASRLPVLGGLLLRGQLEWEFGRSALERAGVVAGKNVGPFARFELEIGWSRVVGTGVSFAISALRPGVNSSAHVMRGPTGDLTTAAYAEGAVLWNEAARQIEVSPHRSIGRGGVSGLVFVDANASGWLDPGEEPLPGVRVLVGCQAVTTDERGRYTVWDLGPFEDAAVTIDAESLPSPLLVPTVALAQVAVEPNGFREVNLPVVNGAEAAGRVTREGSAGAVGVGGVGGVRVILTHLASGRRHEAVTFHDGTFYALGLLAGDYTVTIPADVLALLGLEMAAPAARCTVAADPAVRAPEIEVHLVPAAARRPAR